MLKIMSCIRLFKTTFNLCFVLILNEDNSFGINNVMFSLLLPFVQHCRVSTYEGAETTGNYLVFNLKKELDQIEKKNHYDNIYSTIICWNFISFRIHLSYWFITREDTTERNDFLYFILLLKYIQKCTIKKTWTKYNRHSNKGLNHIYSIFTNVFLIIPYSFRVFVCLYVFLPPPPPPTTYLVCSFFCLAFCHPHSFIVFVCLYVFLSPLLI